MSKHPIETITWWKAAGIRALKTFAQTAVAVIGTGGGPRGEDATLLRHILATQDVILDRLTALEGKHE